MSSFFAELRRRDVFKVTAAYAVSGWLLMQLAAVLESALHLPTWFDTVTTVLVLIGFPIAVLLSWIFQFTPTGLVRTIKNPEIDAKTHSKNTVTIYSLTGMITLGLAGIMWLHLSAKVVTDDSASGIKAASPTENTIVNALVSAATQSIAVLPFDDFSANNDQDYFGRGISEELLNVLSRVRGLRVVSRTSSFAFTESNSTVGDIAQALQVAHVLEGSVRKSGNTIRITAQLINAQTDEHLWSETYDRTLSTENLFAVQDEIARAIVSQLKGKLKVVPLASYDKTISLRAYELYLQARENKTLRTPSSLEDAQKGFIQVIDLDPNFAPAYAGLAEVYLLMENYAGLNKQVSQEKASPLIERALEVAPDSAEVLSAAAYFNVDLGTLPALKKAEEYALQAIQNNENYADAHFILGGILWEQLRLNEAIVHYKKARTLDPLSSIVLENLARIYLSVKDFENANVIGDDLIRLHPNKQSGYAVLADIALEQGAYSKVHSTLQAAYTLNPESMSIKTDLRRIYNLVGLYDQPLTYLSDPTTLLWRAIYTNDLNVALNELPKITNMVELAWFLYYLREYEKTQQIIAGYLQAYKLLERPIDDARTVDLMLAYTHLQKSLGESTLKPIRLLESYFSDMPAASISSEKELTQRLLFSTVKGEFEQSYKWLDRLLALEYIVDFIDPIYDEIKQNKAFKDRQESMSQITAKHREMIVLQLR